MKGKGEEKDVQPVNCPIMREAKDKLINHAINPNSAADEIECRVCRIGEDEMVAVEGG